MKDIALRTGFSINTVARALKNRDDVAPKSKALIQKTAKEMNYINNGAASYLRTGHSKSLAVILADITNPTFSAGVREIEQNAVNNGYSIMIFNTNENEEAECTAIQTAISKNADGILICPCSHSKDNLSFLADTNIPFVLVGRKGDPSYPWVIRDDKKCGRLVARHLIHEAGCRNILVLGGDAGISSASERIEGFLEELRSAGLEQSPELFVQVDVKPGAARKSMRQILDSGHVFDGIFCFSDIMAMEAIHELRQAGLRIPEDVSVASIDNLSGIYPYLTSVDSVSEVGESLYNTAFQKLIGLITGNDPYPLHTTLDVRLYRYGSVRYCR